MLRVNLAEFRESWTAWLGVSVTFIAANFALTLCALVALSGLRAIDEGVMEFTASASFTVVPMLVALMLCFVVAPVVGSSTSLVVDARRGALARLSLAGATPSQVSGNVLTQLAVTCLACAVVGDLLAVAATVPAIDLLAYAGRENDGGGVPIAAVYSPVALLLGSGVCLLVALLGGARRARTAAAVPPVEALRQAQAPAAASGLSVGGWIGVALLAAIVIGMAASVPLQAQLRYKETVSNLLIQTLGLLYVLGALLSALTPVLVRPLTRAWTSLVRTASPSWVLARATVLAKADRLAKSVVPVMFTVGVTAGDIGFGATVNATLVAAGMPGGMSGSSWESFVILFGLPLLVAIAGGVGSLLMMSRQRDAELALAGIAGAEPRQRMLMPALEALIITGTSIVLAIGMVAPMLAFYAFAMSSVGIAPVISIPAGPVAIAVAACTLVTLAATVLPTLPSHRVPEPRVVARLVAD